MSRGERLLWIVPALVALQWLVVALPGDDVSTGDGATFWYLGILALAWAAAARRSAVAWILLVAYAVAMVVLPASLAGGYDPATSAYVVLSLLTLGLLLWPASRAHVWSDR